MANDRKQMYVDLDIEFEDTYHSYGSIPVWKVFELRYMAKNDIFPDRCFSEVECDIWATFWAEYTLRNSDAQKILSKHDNKDGAE